MFLDVVKRSARASGGELARGFPRSRDETASRGAQSANGRIIAVNRVYWPDESATSQLLHDLSRHLAREGAAVEIVTSRRAGCQPRPPAREHAGGVSIHRAWVPADGRFGTSIAGRAIGYIGFIATGSWRLFRLARAGDIILVKTDPPLMSVPAALVARLRRARLVIWHQDLFPEVAEALGVFAPNGWISRQSRRLRNRSHAAAERHVAISAGMAERLAAAGVRRVRISVIENWACDEISPVAPGANPLRRAWGLEGRFVIGYSGNLGRAHQAARVAELVQRTRRVPGLTWLFIGGGVGLARIEALRSSLPPGTLELRPYQPRAALSHSLSLPDIHLVSLEPACEGLIMPSKLYGIMAAGRPVLNLGAPDGEVAREIARHRIGWTLGPNPAKWAATVTQVMRDRATLATAGERARRAYQWGYRPEHRLAAWTSLLDAIAFPTMSVSARA